MTETTTPIRLENRPRILIVKMWAIGDILMATPLLRALHRQYPGCHITWLVDKRYAAIVEGNPMIEDVIAFDNRLWQRLFRYGNLIAYLKMSVSMRRDLRRRKFDLVINLTAEKWWSLWFQAAPLSIGLFPRANPGFMGRRYTRSVPMPATSLHSSTHYLMALAPLGIHSEAEQMSVGITSRGKEYVQAYLSDSLMDTSKPLVVITPRATEEIRCLDASLCSKLIEWLRLKYDANVVLSGTPQDKAILENIALLSGSNEVRIATETQLDEYVALIDRADLLITTDTSALHVAGAVGTSYIVLFGPALPSERVPLVGNGIALDNPVANPPCRTTGCSTQVCRQCTKAFKLEEVTLAIKELLKSEGREKT